MSANAKQSRDAVARRNVIVPQMRDYDELGMNQEWVPHLMYFHPRSASKKSVSTDQFGARNSVGTKPNAPTRSAKIQGTHKQEDISKIYDSMQNILDKIEKIAKKKDIDDAKKNAAAATAKNNTNTDNSAKNNTAVNSAKNNEPIVLTKSGSRPYSPFESTEEGRETSIHFEQNRGRLPWPVDRGNVFIEFGVSTVPGTKLTQKSDGIHIALPEGSAVKSIADGEVSYVGEVNGDQVVMVRHGKYFTVYQQLSSASVSVGREVKAGSTLGRSGKSIDGEGSIIFTINNERGVPLNPDQWLRPRR